MMKSARTPRICPSSVITVFPLSSVANTFIRAPSSGRIPPSLFGPFRGPAAVAEVPGVRVEDRGDDPRLRRRRDPAGRTGDAAAERQVRRAATYAPVLLGGTGRGTLHGRGERAAGCQRFLRPYEFLSYGCPPSPTSRSYTAGRVH